MKLYISADMEGISGIVDPSYIDPDKGENYERGRRWMTEDVNAIITAALDYGVQEIVVADSHYKMNNILLELLHPQSQLIAGSPRDHSMMHGLDTSFDLAFFVGYHTRQGTPGVLSHTMSSVIRNIYVNGEVVGEFGFNAIYASLLSVPVGFVSGDDCIAKEAKSLLPSITTAVVKTSYSRTSARCLSLADSRKVLAERTKEALTTVERHRPLPIQSPLEVTIDFTHSGQAEMAAITPGSNYQLGSTLVRYTAKDPYAMYKTMRVMMNLAEPISFC
jgi:D-amino peptidase